MKTLTKIWNFTTGPLALAVAGFYAGQVVTEAWLFATGRTDPERMQAIRFHETLKVMMENPGKSAVELGLETQALEDQRKLKEAYPAFRAEMDKLPSSARRPLTKAACSDEQRKLTRLTSDHASYTHYDRLVDLGERAPPYFRNVMESVQDTHAIFKRQDELLRSCPMP